MFTTGGLVDQSLHWDTQIEGEVGGKTHLLLELRRYVYLRLLKEERKCNNPQGNWLQYYYLLFTERGNVVRDYVLSFLKTREWIKSLSFLFFLSFIVYPLVNLGIQDDSINVCPTVLESRWVWRDLCPRHREGTEKTWRFRHGRLKVKESLHAWWIWVNCPSVWLNTWKEFNKVYLRTS